MISFANPIWLYGLLGLLIPVGIHLLSRKEGKTIYIGSIRHLTDSDTAQFSSIRLNEILLLILRLILLSIFVFILAGFTIDLKTEDNKKWLVMEKGVEKNELYTSLIDSLASNGFETHWLADGLPVLGDSTSGEPCNYYKLLTQIGSQADTAIVLSYSYSNRFKGEKVSIPQHIKWLTIEPNESSMVIEATSFESDSVVTRISNSNAQGTSFEYKHVSKNDFERLDKIDSLELVSPDTIDIAIFADPKFDYDKKIIQAALHAIANDQPQKFNISISNNVAEISGKQDFLLWLSDEPCPFKESTLIGLSACGDANLPLVISQDEATFKCPKNSFHWIISKRLNEENALEESLSFSLAKILLKDTPVYLNQHVASADHRSMATEAAFSDDTTKEFESNEEETRAETEPSLLILLFLVLMIERYVAFKRNQ